MKVITNIKSGSYAIMNSTHRIDPFKTDEGDNDATRIKPAIEEPNPEPAVEPSIPTPPKPEPEPQTA